MSTLRSLPAVACALVRIKSTDPGAKNTLAQILAAYHTGVPVVVAADTDPANFWSGNSSSHACLVWSVQS